MAGQIMKLFHYLFLMFFLISCSELVQPPKKLLPKDQMAEIIAELALTDQLNNYIPGTNTENAARFVLKEQKIKAADFNESYEYYLATGELDKILDDAQEIILDKDPKAAEYIRKKIKENNTTTVLEK